MIRKLLGKIFQEIASKLLSKDALMQKSENLKLDFEKSPLRFEYEALLEEYRVLWAEIQERLREQHQITNYALILLAAVVSLNQILLKTEAAEERLAFPRYGLLILSFFYSSFALKYTHHNNMMAYLGNYIDAKLRPRIEEIIRETQSKSIQIW